MYEIIKDVTKGTIKVTESWSISATGSYAPPSFSSPGDEYVANITNLTHIEKFKSFEFDYTGKIDNRYLDSYYRISRDGNKWTQWLELSSNITEFPPFTSTDTMYLDIRFVRSGSSTIGSIKLLDYTINGSTDRDIYTGESTIKMDSTNNSIVIKPPYIYKVFKIEDIEVLSNGVVDSDFTIKYRFSQDYGRTVTNWEPFTKENISTIRISPIRFFQIEYLVESTSDVKIYDINIIGDFQNVTLDYKKTNLYGVREDCNCLKLGITGDPATFPSDSTVEPNVGDDCVLPQMTDSDKANLFKPYQLDSATDLLNKMSSDANEIFGHEVIYFLTDPDKKGTDYTFHEYQLLNYVAEGIVKASVENNQFPDNTGAINQFDLMLFDTFEIHIPKVEFKSIFGVDKRPAKEDFLYFCEINKMFTVEHSHAFRGFNNNSIYYKIMLKKYNQKSNVIGANQTITDKVRELTKNSTIDELFGVENIQDKKSVANKDQFKPLTKDPIRANIKSLISKEIIENAEIILSRTHYDLSSVKFGSTYSTIAVEYSNMKNHFKISDNTSYTSWFNINNYTVNDNYHLFNYYDDSNGLGFDITVNNNELVTKVNEDTYTLSLTNGLEEETWYASIVNIDQRQRKISQYIYKRNVDNESDASSLNSTKLKLVYSNELDMTPVEFLLEDTNAVLLSCDMKITNIRMFIDIIPTDQHNKILNQSIIRDDSKYLLFADNANQRLVLPSYPIGQIGRGDV